MSFISSITLKNIGRAIKVLPDLVLGNGAEVAGEAVRNTIKNNGSIFQAAKNAVIETEKLAVKNGTKIGFLTRVTSNIGLLKKSPQVAYRAARMAGKGFFGKIGAAISGFGKALGKNMPLIGALMTIAFEVPNVVKASKEQGIGQGVKEIAKAGCRLAGGGLGAVIGSAICPGIGTFIGWMAGEWLTSKVVGKSYSEQVADAEYEAQLAAEEQAAAQQQAQQQAATQQTTFQGNPYAQQQTIYPQVDYYQQAQQQAQQQTQPSFQGTNPYPQQQTAVTNPFIQSEFNNLTNMVGGNAINGYSSDIFAQNIDFEGLAAQMTSGISNQVQQLQQPLQMQPQVSQINP